MLRRNAVTEFERNAFYAAKVRNVSNVGTQNNGKITSETDAVSGETVTYTYDALNRLVSATSSDTPGWGQTVMR